MFKKIGFLILSLSICAMSFTTVNDTVQSRRLLKNDTGMTRTDKLIIHSPKHADTAGIDTFLVRGPLDTISYLNRAEMKALCGGIARDSIRAAWKADTAIVSATAWLARVAYYADSCGIADTVRHIPTLKTINSTSLIGNGNIVLSTFSPTITSPVQEQILKYDGTNWINGNQNSVSAGSGVELWRTQTASDITGYYYYAKTPTSAADSIYTVTVNNSEALIATIINPAYVPSSSIDAGIWTFHRWAYASAIGAHFIVRVYKRNLAGTETSLFNVTGNGLGTVLAKEDKASLQSAYTLISTDRLVIKLYAATDSAYNIDVHYYEWGTEHYSYIETPLSTPHNALYGLQGGTTNQYYHLDSAHNYTITRTDTTGAIINTLGVLSIKDSVGHAGRAAVSDSSVKIKNTTVVAGTYGTKKKSATFTVATDGRITFANDSVSVPDSSWKAKFTDTSRAAGKSDTSLGALRWGGKTLPATTTTGALYNISGTLSWKDSVLAAKRAAQLTTARTIGNTSFNGTANIVPDTCNKAARSKFSDSANKIPNIITAGGPIGTSKLIPVITYNAQGRLTAVTTVASVPDSSWKSKTADSAAKIPNIITAAGPIGTSKLIPVITYNAQGRLTAVTTVAPVPDSSWKAKTATTSTSSDSARVASSAWYSADTASATVPADLTWYKIATASQGLVSGRFLIDHEQDNYGFYLDFSMSLTGTTFPSNVNFNLNKNNINVEGIQIDAIRILNISGNYEIDIHFSGYNPMFLNRVVQIDVMKGRKWTLSPFTTASASWTSKIEWNIIKRWMIDSTYIDENGNSNIKGKWGTLNSPGVGTSGYALISNGTTSPPWSNLALTYAPLTHGVAAGYVPYATSATAWGNSPLSISGGYSSSYSINTNIDGANLLSFTNRNIENYPRKNKIDLCSWLTGGSSDISMASIIWGRQYYNSSHDNSWFAISQQGTNILTCAISTYMSLMPSGGNVGIGGWLNVPASASYGISIGGATLSENNGALYITPNATEAVTINGKLRRGTTQKSPTASWTLNVSSESADIFEITAAYTLTLGTGDNGDIIYIINNSSSPFNVVGYYQTAEVISHAAVKSINYSGRWYFERYDIY